MTSTGAALRIAAGAFREGRIEWGKGEYRSSTIVFTPSCCAAGAITFAVDPTDIDGDPRWVHSDLRPISVAAVDELAAYLVDTLGATDRGEYVDDGGLVWVRESVEVVADWNDDEVRTVDEVIAALEAAADRADARQAVSA